MSDETIHHLYHVNRAPDKSWRNNPQDPFKRDPDEGKNFSFFALRR